MSRKLEKLKKQQAELSAQIKVEEDVLKKRAKLEKMVARLCAKHPILFSADQAKVEQMVDDALAEVAVQLAESVK